MIDGAIRSLRCSYTASSAVLVDVGIINEQDSCMVIEPSKIRRERQTSRKSLQSDAITTVERLYFDDRKDKTRNQIIKGDQFHPIRETEEHIVLIREPDSEYLEHLKTSSGTILHLTRSILDFVDQKKIDTSTLVAIGCVDKFVNTGLRGGVFRLLEEYFKKSVHCFVCLLHTNELPLRHLLELLDGVTHEPNSFSGATGKQLKDSDMPVVTFQRIEGNVLPNIDPNKLSTDQTHLLEIRKAIIPSHCRTDLGTPATIWAF